jgi:hypothetical protein
MVKDGDFVAVFNSIHRVMKAEKLLKAAGLKVLLIPAPRSITSDCGLALRFGADDGSAVEQAMEESNLLPEELYLKQGEEYKRVNNGL